MDDLTPNAYDEKAYQRVETVGIHECPVCRTPIFARHRLCGWCERDVQAMQAQRREAQAMASHEHVTYRGA